MKTIHKYPLRPSDSTLLSIPEGAQVLCVQVQHDQPYIWVLVESDRHPESRLFRMVGTGHPMPEEVKEYIGSFQLLGGNLVFHLFEIPIIAPLHED